MVCANRSVSFDFGEEDSKEDRREGEEEVISDFTFEISD